jgi:hypothetical protein
MKKVWLYILVAGVLSGCAFYSDRKISSTTASSSLLTRPASYYCNQAVYATSEGVQKAKTALSRTLNFWPSSKVSSVKISKLPKDNFLIEYIAGDMGVVGSRVYTRGVDFQPDGDGVIEIKISSQCGSRDSPGIGCQWETLKVFEDLSENLVVVESRGGAGLLGVIPVAVGAKYLSIFPRIKSLDATPVSETPIALLSKECPVPK